VAYSESKRYAFPAPFGGLAFIAAWASLLFWTCLCTALSWNRRKATCTRDNALWSSWTYHSWLLRLYIYMAHSWQDSQSWISHFHSRVFSQRWPYCATVRHMFLETILVFFSLWSWPAWIFNVAEYKRNCVLCMKLYQTFAAESRNAISWHLSYLIENVKLLAANLMSSCTSQLQWERVFPPFIFVQSFHQP
jgi:hypothetical protein